MNLPDLLTYADISQLQKMAAHYELPRTHSKHELIRTLLSHMQRPSWWLDRIQSMPVEEIRFWQLLFLDSRETFNLEELMGKGRQALDTKDGNPRSLVSKAIKEGLLFSNVSNRDRSLYHVPLDVRKQVIRVLRSRLLSRVVVKEEPEVYRDERTCMVTDLERFLTYVGEKGVRLTAEAAIYRRDLQTILEQMVVKEEPIDKQRWRFGFGRRYNQYPDRFSLLYDYAYYREYIAETGQTLCLTVDLKGKELKNEREAEQMYNFWLRLYRKPIPTLPLIVKWIYLLTRSEWADLARLRESLNEWLTPYYYMGKEDIFDLLIKMLMHLGVVRAAPSAVKMTEGGVSWVERSAGWDLSDLDDRYTTADEQIFFTNRQGISEHTLNK